MVLYDRPLKYNSPWSRGKAFDSEAEGRKFDPCSELDFFFFFHVFHSDAANHYLRLSESSKSAKSHRMGSAVCFIALDDVYNSFKNHDETWKEADDNFDQSNNRMIFTSFSKPKHVAKMCNSSQPQRKVVGKHVRNAGKGIYGIWWCSVKSLQYVGWLVFLVRLRGSFDFCINIWWSASDDLRLTLIYYI